MSGRQYFRAPGPGQAAPAAPSASPPRTGCSRIRALTSSICMTLSMRRPMNSRVAEAPGLSSPEPVEQRRGIDRRERRALGVPVEVAAGVAERGPDRVGGVPDRPRAVARHGAAARRAPTPRRTASRSPATSSSRRVTACADPVAKPQPEEVRRRQVVGQRRVALRCGRPAPGRRRRAGRPAATGRDRRRRPRPRAPASGRSSRRRRRAAAPRRSRPGASPPDGRPRVGRRSSVMALQLPQFSPTGGGQARPSIVI